MNKINKNMMRNKVIWGVRVVENGVMEQSVTVRSNGKAAVMLSICLLMMK